MDKALRFKQSSPLNPGDTETQTYGCRATNPDICANCYMDKVCAFVTEDHICYKPSKAWPKAYAKLIEEGNK